MEHIKKYNCHMVEQFEDINESLITLESLILVYENNPKQTSLLMKMLDSASYIYNTSCHWFYTDICYYIEKLKMILKMLLLNFLTMNSKITNKIWNIIDQVKLLLVKKMPN